MKTLSEELREEQYAIPGALGESSFADWADRAAALEAEVAELRAELADNLWYRKGVELHAENTALKARIAEAMDWALCTDDEHLRRILAPEGEE